MWVKYLNGCRFVPTQTWHAIPNVIRRTHFLQTTLACIYRSIPYPMVLSRGGGGARQSKQLTLSPKACLPKSRGNLRVSFEEHSTTRRQNKHTAFPRATRGGRPKGLHNSVPPWAASTLAAVLLILHVETYRPRLGQLEG